jgi:hypothetical protein
MNNIAQFIVCLFWIEGFVIAKGFWSTLFCIIPFWAFYLVIEFILINTGLLS